MPGKGEPAAPPGRDLLGVILAGGGSRRFGQEKALFPLRGYPMSAWVLEALTHHTVDQVVITPVQEIPMALGVRGRPDLIPGAGPLGGLHAALRWAREEGRDGVVLLACDLPVVTGELIGRILQRWPSGAPAAVPGSPGPLGFEPLCACYHSSILETVEELLREGRRAMDGVLSALKVEPIPARELGGEEELVRAFTNVNTAGAAVAAEAILSEEGRSPSGVASLRGAAGPPAGLWKEW